MAADPLVYCLEHVTDYSQFERLCSDLMAANGHVGIEPIGGSKDKGRDAIHVSTATGKSTIFAYSVREDWRKKLEEDAEKVPKHKHACDRFVFLCTAAFTANERDSAVEFITSKFGWEFEIYGIERIRSMLATTHSTLVAQHPQIFAPPFFPQVGGLSVAVSLDHIVIDYVDADTALAQWLSRRLSLCGYSVWCRGLAPLAGSSTSETIRRLLASRAAHYVSILSPQSVQDPDFSARRSSALAIGHQRTSTFFVPVLAQPINRETLDQDTRLLNFADFSDGWATGLQSVLDVLSSSNCPRRPEGTSELVLHSYFPSELVLNEPESLSSNLFKVSSFPAAILRFYSSKPLDADNGLLTGQWAFRRISDTHFLSFHRPPHELASEYGITAKGGSVWNSRSEMDGVNIPDLVKELLRKSIIAECRRRGLLFCADREVIYFPSGLLKNEFLRFHDSNGTSKSFTVTGERTHGRGDRSSKFRYQMVPVFVPIGSPAEGYEMLLRIRVRLTDSKGALFSGHTGNSRRKKLCKSWWNADWSNRIMGVMQFLADGKEEFSIGDSPSECIVIEARPQIWISPVRLNEAAIGEQQTEVDEELRRIFDHEDDEEETLDE